jgi:eukaryotic-like serine/threonine-protein kinase
MSAKVGTHLGPYEIVSRAGAGGMGEVWKARDTRLGRRVAIKISDQKFTDRFDCEARAIAALNHPHISALYDIGPDYLVMEYVEGEPLKGPLPLAKALEYARQILDALHAAHRAGIVHRDLKPANILVARSGLKVLDVGLAKRTEAGSSMDGLTALGTRSLSGEGNIVGTLHYMAPEQLQGKHVDARADIFAFGCVLHGMITGKRAFDGGSSASVIAAVLERPAPSISDVAPEPLDRILRRCLAKDPEGRWQSALDVKTNLERISASGGSPVPATSAQPSESNRWPWFLPDGKHFVYVDTILGTGRGTLRLGSLETQEKASPCGHRIKRNFEWPASFSSTEQQSHNQILLGRPSKFRTTLAELEGQRLMLLRRLESCQLP